MHSNVHLSSQFFGVFHRDPIACTQVKVPPFELATFQLNPKLSAPMNHVKYLRAGPAEMPFQNWYTGDNVSGILDMGGQGNNSTQSGRFVYGGTRSLT